MMRSKVLVALILSSVLGCAPNRGAAYERAFAEADVAVHDGRFAVAAERFDEAARTAKVPRDAVRARYEAALVRARAGDVARASAELRAIATAKPKNDYSAQAALKVADLAARTDPASGAQELESVLFHFPDDGVAKVALARLLRSDDDGGPEKALAHLDALLPKVAGTDLEGDATNERAKRLAALGRTEAARDAFLDVARRWPYPKGPYFDDALFRASEMDEKLGRYREAIDELERLLSYRESSVMLGTYERPRYVPALLRIVTLYEERLHDRAKAREALHRLYAQFTTSTLRDDALWREAALWSEDGQKDAACDRLSTLAHDFPDSRYVPCATERCPSIKRPAKSKAPVACRPYVERQAEPGIADAAAPTPVTSDSK
jgi:outer membrane protein assembly factor BamD (BamD/ComL family)